MHQFVRTHGFLDDALTIAFQKRETDPDRLADLCGPEIGVIMKAVGWFHDMRKQAMAVNVVDGSGRLQAMARVIPTSYGGHGLNLSYAATQEAEGRGLAYLATCMAISSLDEVSGGLAGDVVIHAQWRAGNAGSGRLAHRLGLGADPDLEFFAALRQGLTGFHGASASAPTVVRHCKAVLAANGSPELLPAYRFSSSDLPREDVIRLQDILHLDGLMRRKLEVAGTYPVYQKLWSNWTRTPENRSKVENLLRVCRGRILCDESRTGFSPARALANELNHLFAERYDFPRPAETSTEASRETMCLAA